MRLATDPGTVMGTVGYMSPEQVRGGEVDHRSDIFSFGTILYEMLSGKSAFRRGTAAETMTAILREEPAELTLAPTGVSRMLEAVTRHCLEKAPENRFQSARDLAFDLAMFSTTSGVVAPAMVDGAKRRRFRGLGVAALIVAGCAGAFALGRTQREPARLPIRQSVLTYSGADSAPAFSPDGKMIAFASNRDGVSRIWLKQLTGGGEAVLSSGPDSGPRFAPDGSSVLFIRGGTLDGQLFRISVLGGEPRKLADRVASADWSPDGNEIVYVRAAVEDGKAVSEIRVLEMRTGKERHLATLNKPVGSPRWSPDGKWISLNDLFFGNALREVFVVGMDGKARSGITTPKASAIHSTVSWFDSDRLIFSVVEGATNLVGNTRSMVVMHDLPTGRQQLLFYTPTAATTVDLGPDGSLVFDAIAPRQNMREVTLPDGTGKWLSRGSSVDRQPHYSPDGQWVVFSSTMSGNLDIWARSVDSGTLRRITDSDQDDFDPAYTRDGKRILWSSRRSGNYEIWIANADGTEARQLTRDGVDAENPTPTPDGWVIYNSYNPARPGIWRVRLDGSGAERLLAGSTEIPDTSPDGAHVSYHLLTTNDLMVLRLSDRKTSLLRKGTDFGIRSVNFGRTRWTSDGKAIIFHQLSAENAVILAQQDFVFGADTAATMRPVAGVDDFGPAESFAFSSDGKKMALSLGLGESSIHRTEPVAYLVRQPRK